MATTDEIREKLEQAIREEQAGRGGGMDTVAAHLRGQHMRRAEALRQEALTLAICELLDAGLVLADPAELFDQERLCGEEVPRSRFMCELAVGHDGDHAAPKYEPAGG